MSSFFFLRLHLLMPRLSSPLSVPHPTIQPSMSPCFRRAPEQEPRQRAWNPVPDLRAETSSWSGDQRHENVFQMLCSVWVEMASSIILLFCGPLRVLLGMTGTVTHPAELP